MISESVEQDFFEAFANIGDSWLSFLLNSTGEVGENTFLYLLHFLGEKNLRDLQSDTTKAQEIQERLLMDILGLQKNTDYGKQYNFAAIQTVREFCSKHPLSTYEDYQPIIDDITQTGKFFRLTSESVTLFQESSGTTGKTKLIPRTKSLSFSFLKAFQATESVADSYFQKKIVSLGKRRSLALVNAMTTKLTPVGIPRGTGTSGGFREAIGKYKLAEKLIDLKYSSPPAVFLISDTESAYYCHLLFGLLDENLTSIAANFSANVLEAMQILQKRWQHLVNDIQVGQINESVRIDATTRREIQFRLKSNTRRAKFLQTEFLKGFNSILPRIWPQLTHIHCITTGSMQLYGENLRFYAGTVPFYSGGYAASEAWIGVNLEPGRTSPAYTVTPHSAFFEFIPEVEIEAAQPSTARLTSLKIGENYEVVVTTIAGLYRYRLGDVVKCVGYYNQCPIVEFLYRQKSLLNLVGEKVSENDIWLALVSATKLLGYGFQVVDYTTCMEFSTRPWRYVVYVELIGPSDALPDLRACRDRMEEVLSELNVPFRDLRTENRIAPTKFKLVKQGTFAALKNKIIFHGYSGSQFKMPRLLTNSKLIDFVETMVHLEGKQSDEETKDVC